MSTDPSLDDQDQDDPLAAIIARYLRSVEQNDALDRQQLLSKHPEFATELLAFFDDHDLMSQVAPSEAAPSVERVTAHGSTDLDLDETIAPRDSELNPTTVPLAVFGDYELLEEISRGGMGIVFRARQISLDRIVALKMILSGVLAGSEDIDRFYAEALSAAQLNHPNIVPIHDVGCQNGQHFFSMEYVPGTNLASYEKSHALSYQSCARLMMLIAHAVAHAHRHGIVHRDLKPSNVLLDEAGVPKLADFGVAKRLDEGTNLTLSGQIIGTASFMSPEQAAGRNDQISPLSDIYSLGAILFLLCTGRPPFEADHQIDLLLKVIEGEPEYPSKIDRTIPGDLERICMRCLQRNPKDRYPSATALAEDLERFLKGVPVEAGSMNVYQRLKRWSIRQPALVAHLVGLGMIELARHSQYIMYGYPSSEAYVGESVFPGYSYLRFTILFLLWGMLCFLFQRFLEKPRWREFTSYVWTGVDVIFMTLTLFMIDLPIGPLLVCFAMLITASAAFFQVRLVTFTTVSSILAFLVLAINQPQLHELLSRNVHFAVIIVVIYAVIGLFTGFHLRRFQVLSRYFDHD